MEQTFRLLTSRDGKTWEPVADDDNYWHQARRARQRSGEQKTWERVIRVDMGDKVIVTFKDGMPK
jgi:hypothetical protein